MQICMKYQSLFSGEKLKKIISKCRLLIFEMDSFMFGWSCRTVFIHFIDKNQLSYEIAKYAFQISILRFEIDLNLRKIVNLGPGERYLRKWYRIGSRRTIGRVYK